MIKSNDGDNKATQKKKAIISKITTQVDEVKDSEVGHLIVKFAVKEKLENARKEFEENMGEINISVVEKEKIKPKIKVCNVDTDVDNVTEDIREKNKWINDYIYDKDDFKLVQKLKTRDENNLHYIIKCSPEIRKQIFIRGDIRCIRKTRFLTHTKSTNASNVKSSTTVQNTVKRIKYVESSVEIIN